jgi:transcriptional regulator with GAF, ATPase, and Fis domain
MKPMENDIHNGTDNQEFFRMFRKGEEFTKNLLKENELLRSKLTEFQQAHNQSENSKKIELYENKIMMIHEEFHTLLDRYRKIQTAHNHLLSKCSLVESENSHLANLYVASYNLHSTLDFDEVLTTVVDIITNLIGAEQFVIFLMDDRTNELLPAAAEGLDLNDIPKHKIGVGIIGMVAKSGESYYAENTAAGEKFESSAPLVCIPLKIKEHVIGAIALYGLFVQKTSFSQIDYELFELLAGHAATAIFSARLYTQSERKLTTIQNFLDLLKDKKRKRR